MDKIGMTQSILVDGEEIELLHKIAADETTAIPAPVAASLERKGLIMRGWGATHVLTQAATSRQYKLAKSVK